MADDNCENSTDREFEDYFRKDEPADLIPRLENVIERLVDYDDRTLEVATDIVEYVKMQLEAMDEDTAVDADEDDGIAGQRPSRDKSAAASEPGSPTPRSTGETHLEPAAWLYDSRYEDDEDLDDTWTTEILTKEKPTVYGDLRKHVAGTPHTRNVEPLVRVSDMVQWLESLIDPPCDEYVCRDQDIGRNTILRYVIGELEEFTQNDREDIVECSGCGMRQYRENWGGECLDCGATIVQNPVKRRCTDCGNEQEWPETPDGYVAECDECDGYMEDISQQGESGE